MDLAQFGERLARIEEISSGILEHIKRINGTVADHVRAIAEIRSKCAVHDAMMVGWNKQGMADDLWKQQMEKKVDELCEMRSEMKGKQLAYVILAQIVSTAASAAAILTWLASRLPRTSH